VDGERALRVSLEEHEGVVGAAVREAERGEAAALGQRGKLAARADRKEAAGEGRGMGSEGQFTFDPTEVRWAPNAVRRSEKPSNRKHWLVWLHYDYSPNEGHVVET